MKASIVLLPGDGVGPEVVGEARKVLDAVASKFGHQLSYSTQLIGGIAIDETGNPLPEATLTACKAASAVLLGAVGGPKWDDPNAKTRPEKGLLAIRQGLGLYANLRPVRSYPELIASSPLKADRVAGVDLLVLRELTGGLYFGKQLREQTAGTGVDVTETDNGQAILVNLPNGVTFDVDSSAVKPGFRDTLDRIAASMVQYPNSLIDVYGHTDSTGSDAYNQALSERRADAVKRYLMQNYDVAGADLVTVGYGKSKLKDPSHPLAEVNRRVQVINMESKTAASK